MKIGLTDAERYALVVRGVPVLVASAIRKERERCARLAEEFEMPPPGVECGHVGREIAEEIRKGEPCD